MKPVLKISFVAISVAVVSTRVMQAEAQTPFGAAENDAAIVATLHAEGAQVYECRTDRGDKSSSEVRALSWQLREPIATLIVDGKSIGRHYAGPNWDYVDGSGVKGKVVASAVGATSNDVPWLRLDVVDRRGSGVLSDATTVERINTKGGVAQGSCKVAGNFLSVPYSADYVFLRKTSDKSD